MQWSVPKSLHWTSRLSALKYISTIHIYIFKCLNDLNLNDINLPFFTMQTAEWSHHVCFHSLVARAWACVYCAAHWVTQAGSSLKMGLWPNSWLHTKSTYRGSHTVQSSLANIRPPWHHPPVSGDHGPSQQWRSVTTNPLCVTNILILFWGI